MKKSAWSMLGACLIVLCAATNVDAEDQRAGKAGSGTNQLPEPGTMALWGIGAAVAAYVFMKGKDRK